MKLVYEFRCHSCEVDYTLGMSDEQTGRWMSIITCPCCGNESVFDVDFGTDVTVTNLESWEYLSSELLKDNKRVDAIKVCRELTGWDLKKAKSCVEDLPEYFEYKRRKDADDMAAAPPIPIRLQGFRPDLVIIDDVVVDPSCTIDVGTEDNPFFGCTDDLG